MGTNKSMQVDARQLGVFRSNLLKSKNSSLPQDRFCDLDRAGLMNRLERLADVRSAVVARGRARVANPNYPDHRVMKKVSALLAEKLQP